VSEHVARALLLFEQSRYDLAEEELKRALGEDPDDAVAHAMLGLCLAQRDALEEAQREADAAIGLAPDLPLAHRTKARVMHERNRLEEAAASAEEAVRLDPEDADHHALAGAIRASQERWADAVAAAERGLALDAEHVACTNLRALALVKLGRRKEAGATLDRALARDPENTLTHANRGWTLLDQGDSKKALEHFRESLRLDATNEWARAGIVEALKARNPVYALMLRYFLWMAKLRPGARWGIVIGGYLGYRFLYEVGERNPKAAPFVVPVLAAYIAFAVMTWISVPLFNLLLRLSRFGRLALSREQTVASNWTGACLLLTAGAGGCWALGGGLVQALGFWFTITFGLLVMPLSAVFSCPAGWPRRAMTLYTAALLAVMVSVFTPPGLVPAGVALNVFLIGVLLSAFVANWLIGQRVRR